MTSANLIRCESGKQAEIRVRAVRAFQYLAAYPLQTETGAQHRAPSYKIICRRRDLDTAQLLVQEHLVRGGPKGPLQRFGTERAAPVKRRDSVVGDADGQLETHPSSLNPVQPRIRNGRTRPNDPLLGIGTLRPLCRLGPSRLGGPGHRLITCGRMR